MSGWHDDVFFGIHYDLHAGEQDTELGAAVTPEHLRERLEQVRPDWVQCDCKGHPGWTSWPTKTGYTSPGVVKDALRVHRDVTKELGIKLGMHYSGVIDSKATDEHPEWRQINANGEPNTRGATCRLSAYRDELMIPQLLELVDDYGVDGFWVDGENWASQPCWCERCKAAFTERTRIPDVPTAPDEPHWNDWLAFQRQLFVDHVTAYADAVHARKPECAVCSNWAYTIRMPEAVAAPVDYLSGDYTPDWGAARAALEGRLLDQRGLSWDLMAWGFTRSAGDGLWQMKESLHLCQEVAEVVALGGAVMVYAKPERSGWLVGWHHDILADVADFCRARRDACFQSETVPQAAVLHPAASYYADNDPLFNYGRAIQPIEGALNALLETHRSTDILTEERALERLADYPLVVVPERPRLGAKLIGAIEAYAANGGHVLMSGAHLAAETAELVGADPRGEPIEGKLFLPVGDMAVGLGGPWQAVRTHDGVKTLACRLRSEEPDSGDPEQPLITRRRVGSGTITAAHGPLFRAYVQRHYPLLRRLIAGLIDPLGIEWLVEADAPPRLEIVLRRKDGRLAINLLNRGAGETLGPNRVIVDDLPPVERVTLRIRTDREPTSLSLVPSGQPLEFVYAGGVCTVHVPQVAIHEALVIE